MLQSRTGRERPRLRSGPAEPSLCAHCVVRFRLSTVQSHSTVASTTAGPVLDFRVRKLTKRSKKKL